MARSESGGPSEARSESIPPPPPVPPGVLPTHISGYGGSSASSSRDNIEYGGLSESIPPPPPIPRGVFPTRISGYRGSSASSSRDNPVLGPRKATRPGFGNLGRPTNLYVNHFQVDLVKRDDVYQYIVTIDPPVTSKSYRREIMKKLRETYSAVEWRGNQGAYDGDHSLFTSGSLNFSTEELSVFMEDSKSSSYKPSDRDRGRPSGSSSTQKPRGSPGEDVRTKRRKTVSRGRDYKVTITFASKIRMSAIAEMMQAHMGTCSEELEKRALDAFRVLDIALRESASQRGYLLVRDNFYHPDLGPVCDLGEGVHGWRGYHTSVKPTGSGSTLNLDISMATVLKPVYVEEFLKEKFRVQDLRQLQNRDWHKAKGVLKGIRIETKRDQVSQTYKIAGFSDKAIRELRFKKRIKDNDGNVREEEVSVRDYFKETYAYTLKYPDLPALDVGNRKKPIFIPIELGKIVAGQRYMKTLTAKQRNNMIGACKQNPRERQQLCEKAMAINNYNSDKIMKEFGLVFGDKLAAISGRILPPPQILFGNGRTETPSEGSWNFSNKEVLEGAEIDPWVVAVFDERTYDGENIGFQLMECCRRQGLRMKEPVMVKKERPQDQNYTPQKRVELMLSEFRELKPMFILAVMPADDSSSIYEAFKRRCELDIGVVSQCMRPRHGQLNRQFLGNLALKINMKMGGLNSLLSRRMTECLWPSTIIFGMDVSHGSPGEEIPSIAAVVATKNWPNVFQYAIRARMQPAKMEMIEDLRGMVKSLLIEYYKTCISRSKSKPDQIIVYRDGLSESQFAECLEKEVTAFRSACRDIEPDYNPGITFIVAQKRHNTRIFPQGRDALRNGNVIPGTVVDRDICHPHNYDFFLVSQAGFIGTSRPTHYHVLVNESNKFTPDDIQSITNNLCYTFGRCSKSISMAAPAAYAHLVAKRYGILVDTHGESDTASSVRSGGQRGPRSIQALPKLKIGPDYSMFFC